MAKNHRLEALRYADHTEQYEPMPALLPPQTYTQQLHTAINQLLLSSSSSNNKVKMSVCVDDNIIQRITTCSNHVHYCVCGNHVQHS